MFGSDWDQTPGSCITVKVGDGLTRWTDGKCEGTKHQSTLLGIVEDEAWRLPQQAYREGQQAFTLPCLSGVFKSTYHRVRAPTKDDPTGERYSIPYFVNPRLNYVMQASS